MLTVRDTGKGMDAETVAHVFEPIFSTKHEAEGGGLGLAAVCGFVKQSGGYIRVESELGKGTVFSLNFPEADKQG